MGRHDARPLMATVWLLWVRLAQARVAAAESAALRSELQRLWSCTARLWLRCNTHDNSSILRGCFCAWRSVAPLHAHAASSLLSITSNVSVPKFASQVVAAPPTMARVPADATIPAVAVATLTKAPRLGNIRSQNLATTAA